MPNSLLRGFLAFVALVGLAGAATGQPLPWGSDFQVGAPGTHPDVAVDATGNSVVVWGGDDIFAQRLDRSANHIGEEVRVNTYTTWFQEFSDVAMAADGDIIVVWRSSHQDGDGYGVYGQLFDASGTPRGGEFRVNTVTEQSQLSPAVAAAADGSFVVVWHSEVHPLGDDVLGQRYDPDGTPLGGEFMVNTTRRGGSRRPAIAADPDGNFVVVWMASQQGVSALHAQRFDASGSALGGEFLVNTSTSGIKTDPSLASDEDGNFVVSWTSRDLGGSESEILARRFDASGNALTGEFRVNSNISRRPEYPSAAMDADGDFVVAWRSRLLGAGTSYEVRAQAYDASGSPFGGEFQINSYTPGHQHHVAVAARANGDVVAIWYDNRGTGEDEIWGQRFAGPGIHLDAAGFCPGPVTVSILQAPPRSEVGIVAATNLNGFTKGGTLCAGTRFEIGEPGDLPPRWVIVDDDGRGSIQIEVPDERCYLEALALADCSTSGAVWVP
jgi:hypothetical protein